MVALLVFAGVSRLVLGSLGGLFWLTELACLTLFGIRLSKKMSLRGALPASS